jgi:DNA-binding transcriptional LysR family regulator
VILSYPDLMIEAAVDGLGVAYVLEHEAAAHIATERLVSILENQTPPFFAFSSPTLPASRSLLF